MHNIFYMKLKQINKRIKTVKVADLKLYPGNPRRNNESAKMVAKSIAAFGYINLIVVNPDNYILAGNTRCKALKILDVEEIEVLEVSGLTEQEERNFVIVDNRVGEFSQWNYAGIDRMVEDAASRGDSSVLKDMGMSSFHENKSELEALINS